VPDVWHLGRPLSYHRGLMTKLPMIDVSADQHLDGRPIDWHDVAASGVKIVAINIDSLYLREDAVGAHAARISVLYYWYLTFYDYTGGPQTTAKAVAWIMGKIEGLPRDLGVAVDLEGDSFTPKGIALAKGVLADLPPKVVHRELYIDLSNFEALPDGPDGRAWGHHIWLAEYSGQDAPSVPCWAWQYEADGQVPGIETPVDRSWWYG
jgi:hypothetical protein